MSFQNIARVTILYIFILRGQIVYGKTLGSLFSESTNTISNQCDVTAIRYCVAECIGLTSATNRNQSASKLLNTCKFNYNTGEVLPHCDPSNLKINKKSKMKVICGINFCTVGNPCPPSPPQHYPSLIDNCTHIILDNFIEMKSNKTHKHALSVDLKRFQSHNTDVLLENKRETKIIASVTGSAKFFSMIAASKELRNNFISQAVQIVENYKLDGIEMQWRFPHCWQGDCSAGTEEDSVNFVSFLSEIRKVFKPKNWLISSILPHDSKLVESAYELEETMELLDWMVIETHNYHLNFSKTLSFHAPLNKVRATMEELKEFDIDYSKLIIRVTSLMATYILPLDTDRNKKKADRKPPSVLPGAPGSLVDSNSELPFSMYCQTSKIMEVVHASESIPGTYMYIIMSDLPNMAQLNRWSSIEDMYTIGAKMEYVKKFGFGGAMLDNAILDDIPGACQCGTSPMLLAFNNGLRGDNCELPKCVLSKSEVTEIMEKVVQSGEAMSSVNLG